MREQTLRWRGGWARLGSWRGSDEVAYLSVGADRPPTAEVVDRCLGALRHDGYRGVVTSALSPSDSLPFVDAGFRVRERLHLLAHDLRGVPRPAHATRRATRRDHGAMLEVDAAGFDAFWRFDDEGLLHAIGATPVTRVRAVPADGAPITGFAITGRAGAQGYLQRLAVAPDARRHGYGRALIVDGLRWVRRHGATQALVNTQEGNETALRLYRSCGFQELPYRLAVMGRDL